MKDSMYRGDIKIENTSTEYLLQEYDDLISCKSLGSYNCCEMISIFLWNKETKTASNVYTIFVFEERPDIDEKTENLLNELTGITDMLSIGIQRKVLPESEIRSIFQLLCCSRNNQEVDIGEGKLKVGNLEGVPKVFVQQNSTKEVLLNKVLKNNFRNGSYILEFFDTDKTIKNMLNAAVLKKMTDIVYRVIPIDLFSVSDRIGNFVFQFPSLNLTSSYMPDKTEMQLTYQVSFNKECEADDQYLLLSEGISDDTIVGFGSAIFKQDGCNVTFAVGDASRICKTTIVDVKRQLVLSRQETSFMREISTVVEIGSQYGNQRVIYDENGDIIDAVEPNSAQNISVGPPVIRLRDEFIKKRQYSRRVEDLYIRAEFRRYGKKPEHQKALDDVIALMNRVKIGKVYLWDPYLTVEDILHTWYYTTSMNVTLYAITSGEIAEKSKMSVGDWIQQQKKIMDERSNHYGIRAEIRCQWAEHGYSFHDRFLMVLSADQNKPFVWSLGTSVNSLGNKHHIIQSVEHPQMIVDTFEELWDDLSASECLVWKKGT